MARKCPPNQCIYQVVEETDKGTYLECRFCGTSAFVPKTGGGGK